MVNKNIQKELQKQEQELQKILEGIQELPSKQKGSVDTTNINQYTETLTTNITPMNTEKIKQEYQVLLKNKTNNIEQAIQERKTELKQRISAKVLVNNNKGDVGIFTIIGYLPEEKGVVHEYLQGRKIPSNEWHATADGLEETLNVNSHIPVKVIVEDTAQGLFEVKRITLQTSLQ